MVVPDLNFTPPEEGNEEPEEEGNNAGQNSGIISSNLALNYASEKLQRRDC